jgi:hypothetical protein
MTLRHRGITKCPFNENREVEVPICFQIAE